MVLNLALPPAQPNQMNHTPIKISYAEIKELALLQELQDMWGAEDAKEMEEFLSQSYCAKFTFTSGSPGYCGDLFIIQGDCLTQVPPVRVIREDGRLVLVSVEEGE